MNVSQGKRLLTFDVIYSSEQGFPVGSDDKESACNPGNTGLIPGSGRSPGEGNGNPLQCSCLGNSMDRGARQLQCVGHKSQTQRVAKSPPPPPSPRSTEQCIPTE